MTLLVKLNKTMFGVLTPMADSTNCLSTNVTDGLSKTVLLIILAMVYIYNSMSVTFPRSSLLNMDTKCCRGNKH